jgi:hypothetical protein
MKNASIDRFEDSKDSCVRLRSSRDHWEKTSTLIFSRAGTENARQKHYYFHLKSPHTHQKTNASDESKSLQS